MEISTSTVPVRKVSWPNVYVLAVLAALFSAVFKAMDNVTVHNYALADDQLTAAFAYLLVGGWAGAIFGLGFSLFLGKKLIDSDFTGIKVWNAEMHKQALISGAIASLSTLFLLWGNQKGDPGTIIALGQAGIIFNVLWDWRQKQVSFRKIAMPMVIVLVGAFLVTFGGTVSVTLQGFLLVVVLSGGIGAFNEVAEQKGVRASDSVNLFVWRFVWLAITGTLLALGVTYFRGLSGMLAETVSELFAYLAWIAVTMFFVFLGMGLKFASKKYHTISTVLIIMAVQTIFGYPITWLGNALYPGLFGELSADPLVWSVRVAGALVTIIGIAVMRWNKPESLKV